MCLNNIYLSMEVIEIGVQMLASVSRVFKPLVVLAMGAGLLCAEGSGKSSVSSGQPNDSFVFM